MDRRVIVSGLPVTDLSEHLKLRNPFDFVVEGVTPLINRDARRVPESRIEFHVHLVGIAVNRLSRF